MCASPCRLFQTTFLSYLEKGIWFHGIDYILSISKTMHASHKPRVCSRFLPPATGASVAQQGYVYVTNGQELLFRWSFGGLFEPFSYLFPGRDI